MPSATRCFPALVADIGGTNARLALLTQAGGQPEHIHTLACADYPDLVAAVEAYLASVTAARPREAVIAIATPVTGDRVSMTNHVWSFSIKASRTALGLDGLQVVNDFTALALPLLRRGERRQIGRGRACPRSVIGLIGPGTGLGVSGLVPVGSTGWQPLASEGGHVSLSPADSEEDAILARMRETCAIVSNERMISGPGLLRLYQVVGELRGGTSEELSPEEIGKRAIDGTDPACRKALELFCAMLGTAAGNLALTLGARGGVYIGGGIVPTMIDFLAQSRFRERFEAKGRLSGYLETIPTFVITADNPALLGAAGLLQHD